MINDFFAAITPIQYYVLMTFFVALFFLKLNSQTSKLLFLILLNCSFAETVSAFLISQHKSIACLISIMTFIHNALWLMLLNHYIRKRPFYRVIFVAFVTYGVINLLFIEGTKVFTFNAFILGSFLYLVTFIYESFYQLKRENFAFFLSNAYIMLFAPVMYLFGMSAIFGFKDSKLALTTVFGGIWLYQFVSYMVNITYYSLVILYIYREKKMSYAE